MKKQLNGYVYYIKNLKTETYYIGATKDFYRRIRQHLCKTRFVSGWHLDFQENTENYTWGILEEVYAYDYDELAEKLCERETHYFLLFGSLYPLYNLQYPQKSSSLGKKYDEERLKLHSESHIYSRHMSYPNLTQLAKTRKIENNFKDRYNYARKTRIIG